jgi:hypothetical protein
MAALALCSNMLFGYWWREGNAGKKFVVATAFLLIADIDATRHGLIRVSPQNLQSLAESLGR